MLRYYNTDVVFQEIPDEVTLAVNISGCPCRCPGCHSKFLWSDTGTVLSEEEIDSLMDEFGNDVSCVCFMGGDAEPGRVDSLAAYLRRAYPGKKTGWYTGRTIISGKIDRRNFDYIKVGPYIAHLGALNRETTNQRLYRLDAATGEMTDITFRFWKK